MCECVRGELLRFSCTASRCSGHISMLTIYSVFRASQIVIADSCHSLTKHFLCIIRRTCWLHVFFLVSFLLFFPWCFYEALTEAHSQSWMRTLSTRDTDTGHWMGDGSKWHYGCRMTINRLQLTFGGEVCHNFISLYAMRYDTLNSCILYSKFSPRSVQPFFSCENDSGKLCRACWLQ